MPEIPKVDTNRLKGNYAQALVAQWLSRSCLVRPVAEGTDIGVDLYCEAVLEESPYLHFWAQVKAIPTTALAEQDGSTFASYSFETRHLRYWERHPIPVYAFLVPLAGWPPATIERVYGVRLTEYIVRNDVPSSDSVTIKTKDCFEASSLDADLSQFLTEIVPWDTSALLLRKGIVAPIPEFQAAPEARFPSGIGFQYLQKVLDTIRDASVHGLYHALLAEQYQPGNKPVRKHFEAVAKTFEDGMHIYGLSMLVRAAHNDGEIDTAKSYITSAIARTEVDPELTGEQKAALIEKMHVLLADFN
jgi:hypothetical protein